MAVGALFVVNAQHRAACSTGDVSDIQMFNLNLNVRVVCRDISPGLLRTLFMFGTSHCCDSSSCYSNTFEFEPASAGAERQTLLSERVVCAPSLCFEHTMYCRELTHTPNAYKLEASNTRSSDRTCAAETLGCRRVESNGKRVYTLPRFPGVYNNWFRSLRQRSREEENTVWAV